MIVNKGESLLINSDLYHQIQRSVDFHVVLCALKVTVIESNSAPKRSWLGQLNKQVYKPVCSISLSLSLSLSLFNYVYIYNIYIFFELEYIFSTCNSRFRSSLSPLSTKKLAREFNISRFQLFRYLSGGPPLPR